MGNAGLLGVLWISSIVGLASARVVVNCLDNNCANVHAVAQGPQDVTEVMNSFANSHTVDFYGNLMMHFADTNRRIPQVQVQWVKLNISYNLLNEDVFAWLRSPQLKYVDITYNSLTTVTVPASVVEFIAERNNLTSITINSRNLQRLILPKNKFNSLRQFRNLSQLTELDLSCNQLEKLNLQELFSMSRLRVLNLANNEIHIVEGSHWFSSLEYLDLSSNLLTIIDEPFNSFPVIKDLYLQNNKIVMWVKECPVPRTLQQINIANNDWDCGNLKTLKHNVENKMVRGSENVNCIYADSPYTDRVIKYRKKEFYALEEVATQRKGNISCSFYKPNPCEGDDNRVNEVARSAMSSVGSFAKQSMDQLNRELAIQQNILDSNNQQLQTEQQHYNKLNDESMDLKEYINAEYQNTGLSGTTDTVNQLNEIFDFYDKENARLKSDIKAEELQNRDKLEELHTVENDIEDMENQKNKLLEELNKCNRTLIIYQEIFELNKQLGWT